MDGPEKELIPSGTLRVGVAIAPTRSALFVIKDDQGAPRGVTVDLATDLAQRLGVTAEFMVASNTGLLTDALEAGTIDVAFMPVDDERRKRVDFGPIYYLVESTFLVTGASGIRHVTEVDRPQIRVVGIANTTTIRAAGRFLKHATIMAAASIDEAVAMMQSGKADAFALSRDSLPPYAAIVPGTRITEGGFQQTGIAIAIPKHRPRALAYVTRWLEDAKHSGVVRRAFDAAGLTDALVAP